MSIGSRGRDGKGIDRSTESPTLDSHIQVKGCRSVDPTEPEALWATGSSDFP